MKVVAEKDVVVQLDRLSMNMKGIGEYTFTNAMIFGSGFRKPKP